VTKGPARWQASVGDATIRRGRRAVEGACMVEFLRNEEGQGLVEYALIIAVIAIAVIIAMIFFREQLSNYFSSIGNNLT
jgi:pilus assembly protein Flp/PilA